MQLAIISCLFLSLTNGLRLNRLSTHLDIKDCVAEQLEKYNPPAQSPLPGIDALLVVHYSKLKDRRAQMEKVLESEGMLDKAIFVTWFDKEDMTKENQECLVSPTFKSKRGEGAKSLSLKHLWAYNYVIKNGLKNALVLEDDAMPIAPGVHADLEKVMAVAPESYDMLALGTKRTKTEPVMAGATVNEHWKGPGWKGGATSSYIISQEGAQRMVKSIMEDHKGVSSASDAQQGLLLPKTYWVSKHLYYQNELGGGSLKFPAQPPQ